MAAPNDPSAPSGDSVRADAAPLARSAVTRSVDPADAALSRLIAEALGAARARLSEPALAAYADGAATLRARRIGRGATIAYLHQAPAVAQYAGALSIARLIDTATLVRDRCGDTAADQLFCASPLPAQKFADDASFAAYLRLVGEITAVAPSMLPLFMDRLPALLTELDVDGLARWVQVGLHTHSNDAAAQTKYFSLDSKDAIAMLKLGGDATLFSHVQRRLQLYQRALWDRPWPLHPKAKKDLALHHHRPFIDGQTIYLPDAYGGKAIGPGAELYRAAATHAAAHLAFSRAKFKVGRYKPIKLVVVSLLEDARVEQLAIRRFPGLRKLWLRWHDATPALGDTFVALVARLSRALLDSDYADPHPWVQRGRADFFANLERLEEQDLSIELASPLANDIGQSRLQFNFKTYVIDPPYRDDNSFLWQFDNEPPPSLDEDDDIVLEESRTNPQADEQQQPEVELREAQVEDPDPDQKQADSPHAIALEVVDRSVDYGEWDYLIGLERPAWVTLFEKRPIAGDAAQIDALLQRNDAVRARIKALIRAAHIKRTERLRKQHEGDRLDLDAAIQAAIDLRRGRDPDPRINMRTIHGGRDLAVLVLLDLSKSTGDYVHGERCTVLDLARESLALLAESMSGLNDRFAIHGFTSAGRRDVSYFRLKDFDTPYGGTVKARLAGLTPLLSTRMGPAIRHAGEFLRAQPSEHKLLLVITDGEPSDIDMHDPKYLTMDAKKACESLMRHGIQPFCMSLDPRADRYVSTIFGRRNFLVMSRIDRLPEKLPLIYLRMTQY